MLRRDHEATAPSGRDETSAKTMRPTKLGRRRQPTVRLIPPEDQPDVGPDGRIGNGANQELRTAAERLVACRETAAMTQSAVAKAQRVATERRAGADRAQLALQQARDEARQADLRMRQEQRRASDAKLELRRALEWAARLEGSRPIDEPFPPEPGAAWSLAPNDPVTVETSSADDGFIGSGVLGLRSSSSDPMSRTHQN